MATIAAPLLAGFSISLIGVIAGQAASFRLPGVTLLCLVVAVLLLITAVQGGFWVRRYRPEVSAEEAPLWVILERRYRNWMAISTWAYNLGIAALLAGVGLALVPRPGDSQPVLRIIAAAFSGFAAVVELVWFLLARRSDVTRPTENP